MNVRQSHKSNGRLLVILLGGVSLLAAVGTFWNYSRHVFSTGQAIVVDGAGHVTASFPASITARLQPSQCAKITFKSTPNLLLRAQVMTVARESVLLQLLERPSSLSPGEACEVTIDTTIPPTVSQESLSD